MVSLIDFIYHIFSVVALSAFMCIILAIIDIVRLKKSSAHSWISLFYHYGSITILYFVGYLYMDKLQKDTANCHKIQREFLLSILEKNSKTEYGRAYNFENIKSREDYIAFHPLTRYHHYEEYIDRIARGQVDILIPRKPHTLAVTSGTTGRCKLIPFTSDAFLQFFLWGIATFSYCMVKACPEVRSLLRVVKFFYAPQMRISGGGIRIGPNSSNPTNSRHNLPFYTTPAPAYEIPSEREVLYLHLLFALKDRQLSAMEANFAALIYYAFSTLYQKWEALVEDIRLGTINPELAISQEVRSKLQRLLKPDPNRATELQKEFSLGFQGIAKRIWPDMQIILSVNTGSMEIYHNNLKHYTEGILHYSPLYAATEGLLGLNIWPLESPAVYLLIPRSIFYEFIPIESSEDEHPSTVCTDEVQEGEIYELVITNMCGLYRYRIGDVIKVVGFYNSQTPIIEFLYRQGQLLNVRGEKFPENIFYETLQECFDLWENIKLIDYCCSESVNYPSLPGSSPLMSPPHYLIFLETEGHSLEEEHCKEFDQKLQDNHFVYRSYRKKGSIAPARVLHVSSGTFQALRSFILSTTDASATQVKIPRVVSDPEYLRFLLRRIIGDPSRPGTIFDNES